MWWLPLMRARIHPTLDRFQNVRFHLVERLSLGHAPRQTGNLGPIAALFCLVDDRVESHQ